MDNRLLHCAKLDALATMPSLVSRNRSHAGPLA
jgi:hypothetical protein